MGIWYCTREEVKSSLSFDETARLDAQVDRAIEDASRSIEQLTHRRFYPEIDTRYFDWPNPLQTSRSWRLWLDENEVVSVSSVVSGGVAVTPFFLEPNGFGPPYTSIDLDLGSNASFSGGDTFQQSVAVTALFGYGDDSQATGALAAATDASQTTVTVTDGSLVGVGDVLRVDDERLVVTGRGWLDSGQTLQTPMTDKNNFVSVEVTDGSEFHGGEWLLLDSERMLVTDVAGDTLTVKRAFDGSVLASHTGSTVYVPRALVVERASLGTTAATHLISAPLSRLQTPVRSLCVAEAISQVMQEAGAYGRTVGNAGSAAELNGAALAGLRDRVYTQFGRRGRTAAI